MSVRKEQKRKEKRWQGKPLDGAWYSSVQRKGAHKCKKNKKTEIQLR